MNKLLKIIVGGLIALGVLVAAGAYAVTVLADRKAQRVIDVTVQPVALRNDEQALSRGKYLFQTRGCMECHGADGAGKAFINDPSGLYVKSPNITVTGVVANYTERDWVRTIRHGIKPSGRPLLIMPSEDFNRLSDEDVAALIAYARSLPSAPGSAAEIKMPLMVKALYVLGVVKDAAEKIDHTLAPSAPVSVAPTAEYGAYVANGCMGCHGPSFSGGKIPGTPPDWPPAANLTPGSESVMPRYDTPEKFVAMMHSGRRPDGTAVSSVMPFGMLKAMDETDLRAIYAFLKTLPPRPHGSR